MRLLVTVGNALQPFDRMLRTVDAVVRSRSDAFSGVCQHGTSAIRPVGLDCVPILARGDFDAEIERADVVISHAGVGSLHTAIRRGHVPIVFARRAHLKEHVNDHQVDLAEAFAQQSRAWLADDEASLRTHLEAFLRGEVRRSAATAGEQDNGLSLLAAALERGPLRGSTAGALAHALAGLAPPLARLRYR